ncbi:nucleotidyltransferase domain-containing protein [Faecalispora anaeroviscerum]|uniref:nucleotidyltransferase domain-containing protein n=1 Tax=Faecalispora anaeroviscerum TaxID=2991836 RepID=UPI0024B87D7D|nr:nucleotidyltransferase [Faecalispora anaeroviscerum]
MINLQKEFLDFHEKIKLSDENAILREKREILLNKLSDNISDEAATYTTFNQGSYAMGTGIKPEDDDYDIDVGVKFNINKDDYTDPIKVKKWVRDALDGHTKSVEIRRSCVTVTYQKDDEPIYHVDFAIYAALNDDSKMYIAKGKEFSTEENRKWEVSDPQGLITTIKDKHKDDDAKQFRRVIRYLKKWRTHNFSSDGNEAPTGISLTILAYNYFSVSKAYDWAKQKEVYDDFTALYNLAVSIKNSFSYKWNESDTQWYYTISINLPVEPNNNLFEKMTDKQLNSFYDKVVALVTKLDEVKGKDKRSDACAILIKVFGDDFPSTVDKSMVGTSESASL